MSKKRAGLTRRDMLKLGLASGAASVVSSDALAAVCGDVPRPIHEVEFTGCGVTEAMPTSPFIADPFRDPLPVPKTLRPGWRDVEGNLVPGTGAYRADGLYDGGAWSVRDSAFGAGVVAPSPAPGHQDALGDRPGNNALEHPNWGVPNAGTHQLWSSGAGVTGQDLNMQDPLLFHIRLQVSGHKFTTSPVVNINSSGVPVPLPPGATPASAGTVNWFGQQVQAYTAPESTIYGFNGTFPGPLINAEYGRPVIVRFENDLDINPDCRDRQDFGAPDWAFLTHLHNGHTAPESDGQPNHLTANEGGYQPMQWSDNLYLMYPAGGDEREKQSFLWFHDHRMHHTGPNVYKGMVGLMPHYDPVLDNGDETHGLRLPGIRTDNGDGSFDVDYDIPMAFYDCALDDGVTEHRDQHQTAATCGGTRPEWWGRLFHTHQVNQGFVGDIFTVNCTAFPVLPVKRRKYRFRFLGASLARQYRLSIREGTPWPFPGRKGQWNFGEIKVGTSAKTVPCPGYQAFKMYQIASEGGLLPNMIERDEIEIWPAKRREVIVDFSREMNGNPTSIGDVFYLTNTLKMTNGRKEDSFDPTYAIPLVKFVIEGDAPDESLLPAATQVLRAAPDFNPNASPNRRFRLERGSGTGETQWLINGLEFNPTAPLALPILNSTEAWAIENGGGGWTHPMHIHMEEHHVIKRDSQKPHPDDTGKEDVVALESSEKTVIFRRFRTFLGNYVAHCHNLAHEDHNMMFGWTIVRKP